MSAKRQAQNQLGPDNWDEDEPAEKEEDGGFKMAPKEVLEKRVIRTAKRRSQATGDGAQKTIFSSFSGFNKTPKSSFAFLQNLTNGSTPNNNDSSTLKSDTAAVSSSSMASKPASNPISGIFTMSGTSTSITKSAFGPSEITIFGTSGSTPAITQSVFSSSKPDSAVNDSPFKVPLPVTSTPLTTFTVKSNANPDKPIPQVTSPLLGVSSGNNNSPFSTTSIINNSTAVFNVPVKSPTKSTDVKTVDKPDVKPADKPELKPVDKTIVKPFDKPVVKPLDKPVVKPVDKPVVNAVGKSEIKDEKELVYYNNLKGLNESVSAWIKKHVEATPLCILTPIFKDYENHLKDIQADYEKSKQQSLLKNSVAKDIKQQSNSPVTLSGNNLGSTLFCNKTTSANSVFAPSTTSSIVEKTTNFTFGIKTPTTTTTSANNVVTAVTPSTGFTFGIKPTNGSTPFPANTIITTTTSTNNVVTAAKPSTGFTFGIKPANGSITSVTANTTTAPFAAPKATYPFTATTTTSQLAATTTTSPFAATTSPFAATTSPFAATTTTSLFGATTATSSFAATRTTSLFAATAATSPFTATTTTSVFASTTTTAPFAAITTTSPFAATTTTSAFAANTTTSPFAANTTTSPFAATTTTSPFSTTTATSPFAAATTTSLFVATTTTSPFAAITTASPFAANTTTSLFAANTTTSPFAANTATSQFAANNGSAPFSFGIGKPFAFNSNIKKSDEPTNEGDDNEDEPPKVEYTPIPEENSVYDKKCKVFVKKDGNFIDTGVGTLYIKKIVETGKYQLLVRANTSLGNVLINMILSTSLPTQRLGKNNVMMVCIPTPDAQPPPTSILIRVKTSEDADELLETLNKFKA